MLLSIWRCLLYFRTHSLSSTVCVYCRVGALERMWKEKVMWCNWGTIPEFDWRDWGKQWKQDPQCPDPDSNRALPEYLRTASAHGNALDCGVYICCYVRITTVSGSACAAVRGVWERCLYEEMWDASNEGVLFCERLGIDQKVWMREMVWLQDLGMGRWLSS
jgi:hypothetical protein